MLNNKLKEKDASGIHLHRIGELPKSIARLCNIQVGVQQMAVEAAVNDSKEMVMRIVT